MDQVSEWGRRQQPLSPVFVWLLELMWLQRLSSLMAHASYFLGSYNCVWHSLWIEWFYSDDLFHFLVQSLKNKFQLSDSLFVFPLYMSMLMFAWNMQGKSGNTQRDQSLVWLNSRKGQTWQQYKLSEVFLCYTISSEIYMNSLKQLSS